MMIKELQTLLPKPKHGHVYDYRNVGVDTTLDKLNEFFKTEKNCKECKWDIIVEDSEGNSVYGIIYNRVRKREVKSDEMQRWYIAAVDSIQATIIQKAFEKKLK